MKGKKQSRVSYYLSNQVMVFWSLLNQLFLSILQKILGYISAVGFTINYCPCFVKRTDGRPPSGQLLMTSLLDQHIPNPSLKTALHQDDFPLRHY